MSAGYKTEPKGEQKKEHQLSLLYQGNFDTCVYLDLGQQKLMTNTETTPL